MTAQIHWYKVNLKVLPQENRDFFITHITLNNIQVEHDAENSIKKLTVETKVCTVETDCVATFMICNAAYRARQKHKCFTGKV